jgi:hypothetical protein
MLPSRALFASRNRAGFVCLQALQDGVADLALEVRSPSMRVLPSAIFLS